MGDKQKLTLKDLPTIDELKERFSNREKALAIEHPEKSMEILKYKNAVTHQFIFEEFDMLEFQDRELVNGVAKNAVQYGLLSIIFPSALNISIARLTDNRIYNLHYMKRFSLRLGIYAVPILLAINYTLGAYTQMSMYLVDKYNERVELYHQFPDPSVINPYFKEEEEEEEPENSS
ncbi:hypothetical protein SteCoe_15544 [Stentor coeruleus]|uniref:Uncharacterized protein n=1 Tax=Stentor coeruleus TaxID=5963 RepID=A0A1R2C3C2_9CILI|nr:hypothetical protein SteCoe_15544 [Stentor coeruleus]